MVRSGSVGAAKKGSSKKSLTNRDKKMTKRQWTIIQYALSDYRHAMDDESNSWDEDEDGELPEDYEIDELVELMARTVAPL